jgi:hypothetical protein
MHVPLCNRETFWPEAWQIAGVWLSNDSSTSDEDGSLICEALVDVTAPSRRLKKFEMLRCSPESRTSTVIALRNSLELPTITLGDAVAGVAEDVEFDGIEESCEVAPVTAV